MNVVLLVSVKEDQQRDDEEKSHGSGENDDQKRSHTGNNGIEKVLDGRGKVGVNLVQVSRKSVSDSTQRSSLEERHGCSKNTGQHLGVHLDTSLNGSSSVQEDELSNKPDTGTNTQDEVDGCLLYTSPSPRDS